MLSKIEILITSKANSIQSYCMLAQQLHGRISSKYVCIYVCIYALFSCNYHKYFSGTQSYNG